jgi:two-component system sensor histidine kinase AlgZ
MLRVLLGANALALAAALVASDEIGGWLPRYLSFAAWVQPLLFVNLGVLAAANPLLRRVSFAAAVVVTLSIAAASAAVWHDFLRFMAFEDGGLARIARSALLAAMVAGALLFYFELRARAFPAALAEARLQALNARIRPHFLFNSLNAILSLIRSEPRRAETALEELAELMRALLRDTRELTPLADEIALCRQYLDLEKLRLGDRLRVDWDVAAVPADLRVPPLMLQPLIENAVHHGIEPMASPGSLRIGFSRAGDELAIEIVNPLVAAPAALRFGARAGEAPAGSHMALANIRERLALHYDLAARLNAGEHVAADGTREYRVRIVLPCRS